MYLTTAIESRPAADNFVDVGVIDRATGKFVVLLPAVSAEIEKDLLTALRSCYHFGRRDRADEVASVLRGVMNL